MSFGVLLHSRFGSRAASIEQCPSGLHWLAQPSVGMIYHQLPSRLPSFCIWQFSTCHVEIKIRKFKVLPILHVQIRIWKPRQTIPFGCASGNIDPKPVMSHYIPCLIAEEHNILSWYLQFFIGRINKERRNRVIKIRKFKVLPILHVQIRIWKPRQTEFCKGTGELIKPCFVVLYLFDR
jgi:hypothetical protein